MPHPIGKFGCVPTQLTPKLADVNERMRMVQRPHQHITSHFGDESLRIRLLKSCSMKARLKQSAKKSNSKIAETEKYGYRMQNNKTLVTNMYNIQKIISLHNSIYKSTIYKIQSVSHLHICKQTRTTE